MDIYLSKNLALIVQETFPNLADAVAYTDEVLETGYNHLETFLVNYAIRVAF